MRITRIIHILRGMNITLPADGKLYGIIGHPLGHTMSPPLHNWALGELGLPGEYRAFPTPPEDVEAFVKTMRSLPIGGVSVTIPHKEAVIPLLDGVSDRVNDAGACNTLYWKDGKLLGENTDVTGFIAPLKVMERPDSALVLGAGGASRAIIAGLKELGVGDIMVSNRSEDRAAKLAEEFDVQCVPFDGESGLNAGLIINTTPLGMAGDLVDRCPVPEEYCLSSNQVAYDIVYNPLRTKFLQKAESHGCRTIDGLDMFIGQAAEQFRLWTGKQFDNAKAKALVAAELAKG